MNRLSTLLVVALTTLSLAGFAQQKKKKVEGEEPPVKRLANIISYRVMIKDTASLATISKQYASVADYNKDNAGHFMAPDVAEKFVDALQKLNPTEKLIIADDFSLITEKRIKEYWSYTATESRLDNDGNAVGTDQKTVNIKPADIIAIQFYEDWKIDPVTLQMSKRLLAYTPVSSTKIDASKYVQQRMFTVVTDDNALQKLKDHYPSLN